VSDSGYGDFEFERRFFVRDVPLELLSEPAPVLIVQSYFVAAQGYALRMRVQSSSARVALDGNEDIPALLDELAGEFDFCALTVKGPMVEGTRYEAEREIDLSVRLESVRLAGSRIIKTRYAIWLNDDGWVVDVFGGLNRPLVIAECERGGPVTDLRIPAFCLSEVTDDARFANDGLANAPFSTWAADFDRELATDGPRFLTGLGQNRFEPRRGDA
jgi:CYTH domain-containing protein